MNEFRAAVKARQPKPNGLVGRRRGRPRRATVLGLVAALTVAAGAGWWLRRSVDDLAVLRPDIGYVLPSMDPGKTSFFLGGLFLEHPGKDVEILDVKVLTSPNVEYLGAFTVWPRDFPTNKHVVGTSYPPPQLKDRHPLHKVIRASETAFVPAGWKSGAPPVTVALGFRITAGDVAAVNGVRVIYKVSGETTHADFHHAVTACVKPHPCDAPRDASGRDFSDAVLHRFGLVPGK